MLKRTPFYDFHAAAGGRMVDFAGWEMPVQYRSILEEHKAVRKTAGLFDVSHMGEVDVTGPDAQRFLNHLVTNDVTKLFPELVVDRPLWDEYKDLASMPIPGRMHTLEIAQSNILSRLA